MEEDEVLRVDADLWQAVQDKLRSNLQGHKTRATAINPSLLTGLVFDDQGHRLTPTHAKKGARRYRYYVSRPLHAAGRDAAPEALRWPAQELEQAVLQSLKGFLTDESRLMGLMAKIDATEVRRRLKHARGLAEKLALTQSAEQINVLQRVIDRVTVHSDKIQIAVNADAVWSSIPVSDDEKTTTLIDMPVQLRRSGMSVRLIVRAPGTNELHKPDTKLVVLLAKAQDWFARLASGRSESLQSISREEGVSSAYVSRVVDLAFLAPDVVQWIVRGDCPHNMNSDRLIRMVPLPIAWDDQRAALGMSR